MTTQNPVWWSGPICGLGNRMMALAAVRACAGERVVRFLWSNDASCPGDFADVFTPSEDFCVAQNPLPDSIAIETGWEPYGIYEAFRSALNLDMSRADFSRKLVAALDQLPFHPEHLKTATDWRRAQGDAPLAGIHIRRTDRTAQHRQQFRDFLMRKSGLNRELPILLSALYGLAPASVMRRYENDRLFAALRRFRADQKDSAFAVFADDETEAQDFERAALHRVPDARACRSLESGHLPALESLRRTSLVDAMIDLLCLAQCDAIAQSNRASTFSLVAALLGRSPILTATTRYPFWHNIKEDAGVEPTAL